MSFYRGLTWISGESIPDYTIWRDKTFKGYFALNYAHKGNIFFAQDEESPHRVEAPVAWLSWPGPRFRYGHQNGETWDHRFITFTGPRVGEWIRSGLFPLRKGTAVHPISHPEKFRLLFDELLRLVREGAGSYDQAVHTLEGLLLELPSKSTGAGDSLLRKKILYATARLRERPEVHWDFEKMAFESGLSYSHFRREFKKETGSPPNQVLITARLLKAGVLLRDSRLSLLEVSQAVGLDDLNYFCKLFKKHYALTPGTYRKEIASS